METAVKLVNENETRALLDKAKPSSAAPHAAPGPGCAASAGPAEDEPLLPELSPFVTVPQVGRSRSKLSRALLLVYFFLTFTQELPTTALSLILVNELDLSPEEVTIFYATVFVPWTIKPVYGVVSDNLPLFWQRRRPYLVLCSAGTSAAYLILALRATSREAILLWSVVGSICSAFSEVVTDSIAVESINKRLHQSDDVSAAGAVQSSCMTVRTLGSVLASGLSIPLLAVAQPRTVVAAAAVVPVFTALCSLRLPEVGVGRRFFRNLSRLLCEPRQLKEVAVYYWRVAKLLYVAMFFLFVYNAMPLDDDVYSVYLIDAFDEFQAWELATFQFVGLIGSLVGTLVYWRYCTELDLRVIFVRATVLSALAGCTRVVLATGSNTDIFSIPDQWFVPIDGLVVSFCTRLALMPGIVLAAQSCPPNVEATVYSLFSSNAHVASLVSSYFTAQMSHSLNVRHDHYGNAWIIILVCNLCKLLPLSLLRWLPTKPLALKFPVPPTLRGSLGHPLVRDDEDARCSTSTPSDVD